MDARGSSNPKLKVRNATKVYSTASGDLLAIDRCSLDVHAGEIVSIVGPSGCGKTTLLWSMSGLHGLTSGDVLLDGQPIIGPSPEIGMVFQDANLLPWRNLDANINFPFEIKHQKPDRDWIARLTHRVGLDGFGARMPRELSGGMQQRAALVRALSFKPSVLLMDEPFGALDAFWLGVQRSPLFANTYVVRAADLDDPDKKAFLDKYLRAWSMGLEFSYHNPMAAVEAVFEQFPTLASNIGPELGATSILQQINVVRGDMSKRGGWGDHDMAAWQTFFDQLHTLGQITNPIKAEDVCTNACIAAANDFDHDKVKADAEAYPVSADFAAINIDEVKAHLFDQGRCRLIES